MQKLTKNNSLVKQVLYKILKYHYIHKLKNNTKTYIIKL